MTEGRNVPPVQHLTLSTGITVGIRKVSPFTLAAVQKSVPVPTPPLAPGVGGAMEPNESDPDYQAALQAHAVLRGEKITQALLQLGLEVAIDQAALDAFKADMAALGVALEGDDKQLYIRHIAIGTPEDMNAISQAVTRTTMPTEEAVGESLATFSGDVSGPQSNEYSASAQRGQL